MANYKPQIVLPFDIPAGEAHSMDVEAFDDALRSQGVALVHFRSMGCPQGIVDVNDTTRRIHEDHEGCSNGFLYKRVGVVTGLLTGNSAAGQNTDLGMIDGATAQVTLPRQYDKTGEAIYVAMFDRFYLDEDRILVPNWEQMEFSPSGVNKLRWPAKRVEHLVDNRMVEYAQGQDFELDARGNVRWIPGGKSPGIDPDSGRGRVFTAWYLYKPYWYVTRLNHEVRVVQTEDANGNRQVTRMPYALVVTRENIFENKERNNEPENQGYAREQRPPRDGSFGPG